MLISGRFILVVSGLKPVLRRVTWRSAGCKFDTTSLDGVSVLVIGNWLGLQISKPDDKDVDANGDFTRYGNRQPAQRQTRW